MDTLSLKTIERRRRPLRERRTEIAAEYKKLVAEEEALYGRLGVTCPHCQKQEGLAAFTFIKAYWYVTSIGYSDGYWKESELANCSLACPRCAGELRIRDFPASFDIEAVIGKISVQSFFKKFEERRKE